MFARKLVRTRASLPLGSFLSRSRTSSVRGGLLWTWASRFSTQVVQLGCTIALARLLSPGEFGTVGMLLVFTGFAQLVADMGLGTALIHKQTLQEADTSTAFWMQMLVGSMLTATFYLGATKLAEFFGNLELQNLSRAMSFLFVIQALGAVHNTMLRREFRFRYLGVSSIIVSMTGGSIAVVLALRGFGAWALLWQIVTAAGLSTIFAWVGTRWSPRFIFSKQAACDLGRYGMYLLGSYSLNYWLRNGDNLIIGRSLGSFDLGIYTRAYSLMLLANSNISAVFGQVIFPALTKLQDDREQFRDLYMKSLRMIAFASFPLMAGVGLIADEIVLILYGPQWVKAIRILRLLSIVGLFQSIIFPVSWVFTGLGRTKEQFMITICISMLFIVAILLGVRYGILGVAVAYAGWSLFVGFLWIYVVNCILNIKILHIVSLVSKVMFATVVMAGMVLVTNDIVVSHASVVLRALISTSVGALSYLIVCWMVREPALASCSSMIVSLLRRESASG
jgi:O-antigen/teichoic acid export membrane protein